MNLNEAQLLLSKHNISFELQEYENEKEYWHHISLFPDTKKANSCKVIAIIIKRITSAKAGIARITKYLKLN